MSAVSQRSKRRTAGKRMQNLVGKALEEDEQFWAHDTWGEDDGSDGNESFVADDDDEAGKDEFDSDFNDSESDHEQEEREAGEEEERQIRKQERGANRNIAAMKHTNVRNATTRGGRGRGRGRGGIGGKAMRRIIGEGVNAGLVLSMPPSFIPPPPATTIHSNDNDTTRTSINDESIKPIPKPVVQTVPPSNTSSHQNKIKPAPTTTRTTLASTRSRRRDKAATTTDTTKPGQQQQQIPSSNNESSSSGSKNNKQKRKHKKRIKALFTQEELLLEAVKETEPENLRWLLGRKRLYAEAEASQKLLQQQNTSQQVLHRYISKRGSYLTLTFCDMDAVPKVFSRSQEPQKPEPNLCVITGKRARYKDPKTGLCYYDLAAFRELRKRGAKNIKALQQQVNTKKGTSSSKRGGEEVEEGGNQQRRRQQQQHAPPAKKTKIDQKVKQAKVKIEENPRHEIKTIKVEEDVKKKLTTRAQQTVQDPARKLTITTRNALKLLPPNKITSSSNPGDGNNNKKQEEGMTVQKKNTTKAIDNNKGVRASDVIQQQQTNGKKPKANHTPPKLQNDDPASKKRKKSKEDSLLKPQITISSSSNSKPACSSQQQTSTNKIIKEESTTNGKNSSKKPDSLSADNEIKPQTHVSQQQQTQVSTVGTAKPHEKKERENSISGSVNDSNNNTKRPLPTASQQPVGIANNKPANVHLALASTALAAYVKQTEKTAESNR